MLSENCLLTAWCVMSSLLSWYPDLAVKISLNLHEKTDVDSVKFVVNSSNQPISIYCLHYCVIVKNLEPLQDLQSYPKHQRERKMKQCSLISEPNPNIRLWLVVYITFRNIYKSSKTNWLTRMYCSHHLPSIFIL